MNVVGQGLLLNSIRFHMFYCRDEQDNEKGGMKRIWFFSSDHAF